MLKISDLELYPYRVPLTTKFRGITCREGVFVKGPSGWGDFCAFEDYDIDLASRWWKTAYESAALGLDTTNLIRDFVEVNAIIPAVEPNIAWQMVKNSGCSTVKVKVAEHYGADTEIDIARLEAVRNAIGSSGKIRVDANTRWSKEDAIKAIPLLNQAAKGLDYVEQPCLDLEDLRVVRHECGVKIAADESIRLALNLDNLSLKDFVDIAIIKSTPLGGINDSLALIKNLDLPVVVSSALETSVGLYNQLILAAKTPNLYGACGLGTFKLFALDPVDKPLCTFYGKMQIPDKIPEPNFDEYNSWINNDPDKSKWWINRANICHKYLGENLE